MVSQLPKRRFVTCEVGLKHVKIDWLQLMDETRGQKGMGILRAVPVSDLSENKVFCTTNGSVSDISQLHRIWPK